MPQGEDWVCCWRAQEVFTKSPGSCRSPSGPVLAALLLLCSPFSTYGMHTGQRSPKYPVPWGTNAQMPENPGGWLHTLALTCMRRTVLLQHPSLRQNQQKLLEQPTGIKARWGSLSFPLEQQPLGEQAVAELLPAFQPVFLIWVVFQGRFGGRLHSFWPGRSSPEETKGNSHNCQGGFEISTKSQVAK